MVLEERDACDEITDPVLDGDKGSEQYEKGDRHEEAIQHFGPSENEHAPDHARHHHA
jgi:hypothetical protein